MPREIEACRTPHDVGAVRLAVPASKTRTPSPRELEAPWASRTVSDDCLLDPRTAATGSDGEEYRARVRGLDNEAHAADTERADHPVLLEHDGALRDRYFSVAVHGTFL